MTRKITKQQRAIRKFEYQVRLLSKTTNASGQSMRELGDNLNMFVLAFTGKEPSWPQYNHLKEKPERSRMHTMYGRRKGYGRG